MSPTPSPAARPRALGLVLGDQLDRDSLLLETLDPERDLLWMAENAEEATHVWSHQKRLAFFFAAMRHFRLELEERGWTVRYRELSADPGEDEGTGFADLLARDLEALEPERVVVVQPGSHRVLEALRRTVAATGRELQVLPDRHFFLELDAFEAWADGRKALRLETFYRWMRKRFDLLMEGEEPVGGRWNYDRENRDSFGREGPPELRAPRAFRPDAITEAVLRLVAARFGEHPGTLEGFDLPVTHEAAVSALRDFVEHRLPRFGRFQDAMWSGESILFHSRLSPVLNVKLLSPRSAVEAVLEAWEEDAAPLASVEGFVRQVLGWREFVRGIYWSRMPEYAAGNALGCTDRPVPGFFWDGETDMACVADAMGRLRRLGWAHHIERLMVLGLFAQLLGVHPYRFHEWHLAMYVDAVDWVSLPNALGMSQYGDGGVVGTKPYCASGNYVHRMSDFCSGCRYDPRRAVGPEACPFTTLYWDFLARHRELLEGNHRMGFQLKNLGRKDADELAAIRGRAAWLKGQATKGARF